jgi:hypothetical protein
VCAHVCVTCRCMCMHVRICMYVLEGNVAIYELALVKEMASVALNADSLRATCKLNLESIRAFC